MVDTIVWMRLKHCEWILHIRGTTNTGLSYTGTPNEVYEDLEIWVKKRLPGYLLV